MAVSYTYRRVLTWYHQFRDYAASNRKAMICLGLIFIHSFATQSGPLLLQFVSKRLRWMLAKTGYLLSIKALVAIFVLMVLIPLVNRLAGRIGRSSPRTSIDWAVCRISLLLLAAGNFITGFGTNGAVVILGKSPHFLRHSLAG